MSAQLYLIALGSNRRHRRYGRPREVVAAAMEELSALGTVTARSPVIDSAPLGPSARTFANAAVIVESALAPDAILAELKRMERAFGRRRARRWGTRVLDLDIVLWSGGMCAAPDLAIPHPAFRERAFVIGPAALIAAHWRDPVTSLTLRQLRFRLSKPRPA
ncbi:2-amino-4-hydroxy-6-hydroxymethyldihydropteridine diphosphokinase [Erythrobacter sp. 3-20A1M]|nr:2-amino-4-hydroxy-6-hydroxymethyldihydropteridine diphosphokinase [Erythrobacter sp. 3-20A1M]QWC58397.1 2-amino-4-hydroxy-6-hydroxymethyldihydropteridine diphosphokinase [Erythrobacter sp. 3-20A1M]